MFNWMPIQVVEGRVEEWELKPEQVVAPPDQDEIIAEDGMEQKKVKFDRMAFESARPPIIDKQTNNQVYSPRSKSNTSLQLSVASEDLFAAGKDDIVFEGDLMKFKPGISANFVNRYVQISLRAFRYYRN